MNFRIDLQRTRNILLILALLIAFLYLGREIFVPLTVALILALLLYPVTSGLERHGIPRVISIILTFVLVAMILTGLGLFFSSEILNLFDSIQSFEQSLNLLFTKVKRLFFENFPFQSSRADEIYSRSAEGIVNTSSSFLSNLVTRSTIFITYVVLTLIYTFLFLLYRGSFKRFILYHFPKPEHEPVKQILHQIQRVAQNYFAGVFIVTLIMGLMNSLGLLLIGIDHPFLFGFMGALLTIIPYIGTFIGGLIPTVFAIVNYDDVWKPLSVVVLYVIVQILEGNFITPKIVGNKVSLNPLFAVIALILGEVIWGIPGMILFIPIAAMIKVMFDHIPGLEPYGALLSSDFPTKSASLFKDLSIPGIFKRRS